MVGPVTTRLRRPNEIQSHSDVEKPITIGMVLVELWSTLGPLLAGSWGTFVTDKNPPPSRVGGSMSPRSPRGGLARAGPRAHYDNLRHDEQYRP